jgi:two-component system KDP operon response regulator KdpE
VDDDPAIRTYLRRNLSAAGYRVSECASVQEALDNISDQSPSLVILDLGDPDSGSASVRAVRDASPVPILATSARSSEETIVETLESGADDFIAKPFGIREILARAENVLRHAVRQQGTPPRFISGDLEVDLLHRRVWSKGQEIHLSPKVYEVLQVLVKGAGKVRTHEDILRIVWGPNRIDRVAYLRLAIRELRRAIEADPAHPVHVLTETRVGYRLQVQGREQSGPRGTVRRHV